MTHGTSQARQPRHDSTRNDFITTNNHLYPRQDPAVSTPPPPFAVTYVPDAAPLPAWLSYTSSPVLTTVQAFTYATLLDGTPALVGGSVTLTQFETQVVQLPLTVDVNANVPLAFPYTTAGGTGPTQASLLGGTGVFTLPRPTAPTFSATSQTSDLVISSGAGLTSTGATATPSASSAPAQSSGASASTSRSIPQVVTTGLGSMPTLTMPATSSAGAPTLATSTLPDGSLTTLTGSSAASESESTFVSGGSTSISGGSTIVSDGSTSVVGGSTTVVGGTTLTSVFTSITSPTNSETLVSSSPSSSTSSAPSSTAGGVTSRRANNLTGGQVTGITLGTFAFVILAIAVISLCCSRRRRREQEGGYSNRGRHEPDERPNQWSFVPAARPVSMADDGERSPRSASWLGGMFATRRAAHAPREVEPLTSHAEGNEEEEDEELYVTQPSMAERGMTPPRPYRHLPTAHSPFQTGTPPQMQQTPLKRAPAAGFFAIPRKAVTPESLADAESLEEEVDDSWKAAVGATGALAGVVAAAGGYSDSAQSTPGTPSRRDSMEIVDPGPSVPRRSKYYSVPNELGWIAGQQPRRGNGEDTSSGSGTGTRTTLGTKTDSSGADTSGSSPSRGRGPLPPPPPPPPAAGGSGARGDAQVNEEGRNSASSTYDDSPNVSQLFYSAPRWGTRNNPPTEATIPEESSSPTPSRYAGLPIREVNEPPLIFSRPSTSKRHSNSPSLYSPTVAGDHDPSPYGLSPTIYGKSGDSTRGRTSSAGSTVDGSSVKVGGIVDRIGGVLAGLGLAAVVGRRSPTSDVERALAERTSNDNFTAFSPIRTRSSRSSRASLIASPDEADSYSDDDLSRARKAPTPTYSFEAPYSDDEDDGVSIVPELWPRQPLAMGRERRAYATRSTGTLGQRIVSDSHSPSASTHESHVEEPTSSHGGQSGSSGSDPSYRQLKPSGSREHLRNQASDSTTASGMVGVGYSPPSPPSPPELSHDPRRNTLGRSPTHGSSGSEGDRPSSSRGKVTRRGGHGRGSQGSGSGSGSGSHGSHGSRASSKSSSQHHGGAGDYDYTQSPLMPLRV